MRNRPSFARNLNLLLSGRFLTREYVQSNLPFIFYLVLMALLYISYGYFAEKNVKALMRTESEFREAKARNLSATARLQKVKQRSSVQEDLRHLGLRESSKPPIIIREKDFNSKKFKP